MVRQLGYSMFQTVDNNSFPAAGGSFLQLYNLYIKLNLCKK
jgi:hypothetical protein